MPKAKPVVPEYVRDNLDKLPESRKRRNLTPQGLGALVSLKPYLITKYEMGYQLPTKENYNKLAEYFGWQKWEV